MRFQRSLKGQRPLPAGYHAPLTDRVNTDQAIFQIGGRSDFKVPEGIHLPELLKVKARLNLIKRNGEEVFVAIERMGASLRPYPLYKKYKEYQYEAIQIVFDSFLGAKVNMSPMSSLLLEKPFVTQAKGVCILKQTLEGKKVIVTPPGTENGHPLWGYGGYYQLGCDLKQIEQAFFTPFAEGEDSKVHLSRASTWLAKGIMPSTLYKYPHIAFMDGINNQGMLNLVGEIENGQARLSLQIGVDEKGIVHQEEYKSIAIEQADAMTPFVEVVFKKGGENANYL